jgi:hypothetical protein
VVAGWVVEAAAATELVVARGLQRWVPEPVLLFLAMSAWWPRWRAWAGDVSMESALAGVAPKEQARMAREERATRLRSFAAIVDRE